MPDHRGTKERMEELRNDINRRDRLYDAENAQEVLDAEYDKLFT